MQGTESIEGRQSRAAVVTLVVILLVIGVFGAWKMTGNTGSMDGSWHLDLDAALEAADQTNKPMIFLFTADWCPPCRTLKRNVLTDPQVIAFLAQEFVLMKVDLTDRRGPNNDVAAAYGVRSIPTVMAFDRAGEYVDSYAGNRTIGDFMQWARRCSR